MARVGTVSERPLIGIYGRMNVGKSTLLNRLVGQSSAIVSPVAGTTTDPVRRIFEIADLGPVVWIDTPGVDDAAESDLGSQRVERALATMHEVDMALVMIYGTAPDPVENELIEQISKADIPYILVTQRGNGAETPYLLQQITNILRVSREVDPPFFGNRLGSGQTVVMVCPIDSSAPAGRLILPQVQAMRAALDLHAVAVVVQPQELEAAIEKYAPQLVVTDSQVFAQVTPLVPHGVELTSLSILLSELKGDSELYSRGLEAIDGLRPGNRVLIIENCSHQVSCDDIGRVKIPRWLDSKVGGALRYDFVAGRDPLPSDLGCYALAVQCGGCMVTRRTVQSRIHALRSAAVPVTNYGMLIRRLTVK